MGSLAFHIPSIILVFKANEGIFVSLRMEKNEKEFSTLFKHKLLLICYINCSELMFNSLIMVTMYQFHTYLT